MKDAQTQTVCSWGGEGEDTDTLRHLSIIFGWWKTGKHQQSSESSTKANRKQKCPFPKEKPSGPSAGSGGAHAWPRRARARVLAEGAHILLLIHRSYHHTFNATFVHQSDGQWAKRTGEGGREEERRRKRGGGREKRRRSGEEVEKEQGKEEGMNKKGGGERGKNVEKKEKERKDGGGRREEGEGEEEGKDRGREEKK
ncbi:hypothetical protein niasHT_023282 [Heterodera trifolii]|uniref:Uncharacterized protein n=1 Tax=Heterodera trifolii TaxID=157864 RepID=A0ABD2JDH2_9BILA